MTKDEIEDYLLTLEHELIFKSTRYSIELNREWAKSFPNSSAVYLFREEGEICYIGETGSLRGRMADLLNTKNHTVRRNLGSFHYSLDSTYEKASSKKGFSEEIEGLLNERITKYLTVSYILVDLGRKELEERLFEKLKPRYSLKGKRNTNKK
ncbi:GIY-YIG nuclease family protein [Flagellimonas sp.]|uniref:GIY-YIG nuclease family protein n=1 Tax=Flagellimonas sp. TaxID=2058762 RepID=UPI003BAA3E55